MMFDRLLAICDATTDNLSELADIAAPGDAAFFDGALFEGGDLRGTNLTRFQLLGATLKGAQIDGTTILPESTSLLEVAQRDSAPLHPVEVIDNISARFQTEIISALAMLERSVPKHAGSNIRGPISRRASTIPDKSDSERNFRLSTIRRMRSLSIDIIQSAEGVITIGSVLDNIGRLVAIIATCESLIKRCEPLAYDRISSVLNAEIKELGLLVDGEHKVVCLTQSQWKAILATLANRVFGDDGFFELPVNGTSGAMYISVLLRLFFMLEEFKDVYESLPADQRKIDPVSIEVYVTDRSARNNMGGRGYPM